MNIIDQYDEFENKIGYSFKDKALLKTALTHSSYSNEIKIKKIENYERLEFLGDAVLELVSSQFLFKLYPDVNEGQLTRLRSSMVCEPALAFCARDLGLPKFILLGKGEESTGGRDRDSIISDVFEAIIGAIYLDGGFQIANDFIVKYVMTDLENKQLFYDAKTILQEEIQKEGKVLKYVLVSESGPDHDKLFEVNAVVDDVILGSGKGKSKKQAEQQAAYAFLSNKRNV